MSDNFGKNKIIEFREIVILIIIIGLLYLVSRANYLFFHSLVEIFSIFIAYVIFLIVWKSRARLENRALIFIGIAYFFVASLDLLHTFAYKGMGIFPQSNTNLPTQLWIAARYLESVSLLIAPLLLTGTYAGYAKKNIEPAAKRKFFSRVFLIYTGITFALILSIFVFRNFPDCYIEGSGLTPFKVISEYLICFILFLALIALYTKKAAFDERVFRLLAASIVITIFEELAFTLYVDVYGFFNFVGHCLKILAFYLIYKAIIETGFDDPYTLLFRELKLSEEALRQESIFLRDDQGFLYSMLGIKRKEQDINPKTTGLREKEKNQFPLIQNIYGFIGIRINKNFELTFMEGAVKEITGYEKEDFLSRKVKWIDIVVPEDRALVSDQVKKAMSDSDTSIELEYRIKSRSGEIKWVRVVLQKMPAVSTKKDRMQGFIRDITGRKKAEEALIKIEKARIKEIHHRIKNNLQVISSLLDLQAEAFSNAETCRKQDVIEAFLESQNRVISMALIHEELYKSKEADSLDFSAYLQKLTGELFHSYNLRKEDISLETELEQAYLGMDTAIPLGIIVNELISNSLKHAFPGGKKGQISLILKSVEKIPQDTENPGSGGECKLHGNFHYLLRVSDNGKGLEEGISFQESETLGFQLINLLVEQIDGCIELRKDKGTEFTIWFNNIEKLDAEK